MGIFFNRKKQKTPAKKVGLALGGGGMRGFAHLGALKAFEDEGVSFDFVAGTSVGSLVAALYSLNVKADDMIFVAKDIKASDIKSKIPLTPSDPRKVGEIFTGMCGNLKFSDCDKGLAIIAADLITGKEIMLTEGYLADAIAASCAVPVLFKPLVLNGMHLVDGGLKNNIPSQSVRMLGASEVVAIDINSTRGYGTNSLKMLDVAAASFRFALAGASKEGLASSSVVISPDMSRFSSYSKDGWEQMIENGYNAAKQSMAEIKNLFIG